MTYSMRFRPIAARAMVAVGLSMIVGCGRPDAAKPAESRPSVAALPVSNASASVTGKSGGEELCWALANGKSEEPLAMIAAGANVNGLDGGGKSPPLYYAAGSAREMMPRRW